MQIDREGAWGRVEYAHLLDCGHTERRKRASRSKYLSCAWCVIAERKDEELRDLKPVDRNVMPEDDDYLDAVGSQLATTERMLAKVRAELASRFNVPAESVDIVVSDEDGRVGLSFATIFIPATDLVRIIKNMDANTSHVAGDDL